MFLNQWKRKKTKTSKDVDVNGKIKELALTDIYTGFNQELQASHLFNHSKNIYEE